MQCSRILIHYAEIGTKGRNRPQFVARLVHNIEVAMQGLPLHRVERLTGRLCLVAHDQQCFDDRALARLRGVYGISSFSPALRVGHDLQAICEAAFACVQDRNYETFRVSARRAFKDLPFSSQEINLAVANYVLPQKPAKVQMKGAQMEVHVEVVPREAYVYVDKLRGPGGLPVGISGRVAVLLSGGIDSPVAAYRMMRRGLRCLFIHYHSQPFHSRASQDKAIALARHLSRFQGESTLFLVPFGHLQREVVAKAPPPLRVVLYRRFMMRIAGQLAAAHKAKALVTGEALGQVASQTLSNMVVIDQASPMTVLRPLVALDKYEIVEQAQRLGTYETSLIPDQDTCQLFMPKSPETHAALRDVLAAEEDLDIAALVEACVAQTQTMHLLPDWEVNLERD